MAYPLTGAALTATAVTISRSPATTTKPITATRSWTQFLATLPRTGAVLAFTGQLTPASGQMWPRGNPARSG